MALFGKKDKSEPGAAPAPAAHEVIGREGYCAVCKDYRQFSQCWLRSAWMTKCPCCGLDFESPAALYKKNLPACPRCGEYLEHPGFEYGLCDGCGSKFELVQGAKPGLLPNKSQRDKMNVNGTSWSKD